MTMRGKPKYEDLVEILARHVHSHWLFDETTFDDGSQVRCFDHNFSSGQQITATVLTRLKIMTPIVPEGQLHKFICAPNGFRLRAIENRELGCSYDTVVLAFIGITDYGFPQDDLEECLFALELYELSAGGQVLYTEKMAHYKHLYTDWPTMID